MPLNPYEPVALVSLEPHGGGRRWAIPNLSGVPVGSGTPLVLADPETPGTEIVYVGFYDRALAVRTDGSVVWDVATGLAGTPLGVFGVNYHPAADAIVGLSRDGWIYALDRRTGAPVLTAPFQLPGEPSPPGPPLASPPTVTACAEAELGALTDLGGITLAQVIDILLGNGVEVANYFSIDPTTGRLWVAATAPDGEDGTLDGVSELGALYRLDLVPNGILYDVVESCHRPFVGGSASTPALPHDGSRVYVGDNVGNLLAIDDSCSDVWSLPIGAQITGSIGVASDRGELYASTGTAIHQVIDEGGTATLRWTAALDVFDLPLGQITFNQNLAGIGANGIAFQAGAGIQLGPRPLTITTGAGLLDRETGAVRYFAGGLDETVAVMSTGPDGALYLGNSPVRRAFTYCLAQLGLITTPVAPLVGGISKYAPRRWDLLLRDAACAGHDRMRNAVQYRRTCPLSVDADRIQAVELLHQCRAAAAAGLAAGDLTALERERVDRRVDRALAQYAAGRLPKMKSLCKLAEKIVAF